VKGSRLKQTFHSLLPKPVDYRLGKEINMNWDTRRGSALIIAMIMSIIIISLSSSAIFMAVNEQTYTYGQSNKLKSRYIAEAGLAEGVKCGDSISVDELP